MQTSNTSPARVPTLPFTLPPGIRRNPPWPFPAAQGRPVDDIWANAKKVIATTARAFLAQKPL